MDLTWRQTDCGDAVIGVDGELDMLTAPSLGLMLIEVERADGKARAAGSVSFPPAILEDPPGISGETPATTGSGP